MTAILRDAVDDTNFDFKTSWDIARSVLLSGAVSLHARPPLPLQRELGQLIVCPGFLQQEEEDLRKQELEIWPAPVRIPTSVKDKDGRVSMLTAPAHHSFNPNARRRPAPVPELASCREILFQAILWSWVLVWECTSPCEVK